MTPAPPHPEQEYVITAEQIKSIRDNHHRLWGILEEIELTPYINTTPSEREQVLEKWIKLSECIKKHWGERHEASVYQYNKLVKTLDEFTEELRIPEAQR